MYIMYTCTTLSDNIINTRYTTTVFLTKSYQLTYSRHWGCILKQFKTGSDSMSYQQQRFLIMINNRYESLNFILHCWNYYIQIIRNRYRYNGKIFGGQWMRTYLLNFLSDGEYDKLSTYTTFQNLLGAKT